MMRNAAPTGTKSRRRSIRCYDEPKREDTERALFTCSFDENPPKFSGPPI